MTSKNIPKIEVGCFYKASYKETNRSELLLSIKIVGNTKQEQEFHFYSLTNKDIFVVYSSLHLLGYDLVKILQ